jgi:hypothetical protein
LTGAADPLAERATSATRPGASWARDGYIPPMPPASAPSEETRLALAEGCRLFDTGCFFEAHEVWEAAWHVETGSVRQLLQGLIQVAAGFHKGLVQDHPGGMVRLLGAGLEKIGAAGDVGIPEADRFRAGVAGWLEAARRWSGGGARPVLPLPRFDRSERPAPPGASPSGPRG